MQSSTAAEATSDKPRPNPGSILKTCINCSGRSRASVREDRETLKIYFLTYTMHRYSKIKKVSYMIVKNFFWIFNGNISFNVP